MEIDMSAEIEKDNCRQERESRKREEKTAKLLEQIKGNRFLKNDYEPIKESIERFGVIQGLIIYAASVASDTQEAIDCGYPDKKIQNDWLNVIKGCMFAVEDYCDPDRHTRKIGEPLPYF